MEPNQSSLMGQQNQQNQQRDTGEAENLRKEMQQQQEQVRKQQADSMEELLSRVADNMKQEDNDLQDDHRRHQDLKTSLTDLQQQIASFMQ